MRLTVLALAMFAVPAGAQDRPLTAEEFEAFTRGGTFAHDTETGVPYGAEIYLPGRRVIWHFLDERACRPGHWYPEGAAICFAYDEDIDGDGPECWLYFEAGDQLRAIHVDSGFVAFLRPPAPDEEITCPGFGA
ncbi:MAG: hypothetical protein HLUCCA08_05995 [Rhodobacteraceae bacterium HLUCCA08]|nr:MAG: hypothetical protein HLUCCA08_05995 [Rhodobacteraceae bacterium HLUCCA08]